MRTSFGSRFVLSSFLLTSTLGLAESETESETSDSSFSEVQSQIIDEDASTPRVPVYALNYKLFLEGCASGFNFGGQAITKQDGAISLYRNDLNCLLKLKRITTAAGRVYALDAEQSDENFSTWAEDDTAIFRNRADFADKIKVTVIRQLGSPLGAEEEIIYSFKHIE